MDADRIRKALEIAAQYGQTDGADHARWVIDQMVRALTGCPVVQLVETNVPGKPYTYEGLGESDEYRAWVAAYEAGEEDDPDNSYDPWDIGIAP